MYADSGVGITLTSGAGGFAGNTGLYNIGIPVKVKTKAGYQVAHPGDSIDLAYSGINSRRGRVGENIAHTVTPGNTQGYFFIDMNEDTKLTDTARCITARQDSGISKHKGEHSGVFIESEPRAILTPEKETVRQQGRRIKEPNEPMFTLTVQDRHGIIRYGRVRKLTPKECWRLQGFTDEQFNKAQATGLKDGRLNLFNLLALIAFAYCVIKIFFANIKRGGILLIQMAVGSLYMFSVPRGYADGFNQWMKQVAAICLTAFMQTTLLFLGLLTFPNNMLLGLGIMLAANEVPRIAQQFGLDSSVKVNMMSVVHATTTAVNLSRSVARAAK